MVHGKLETVYRESCDCQCTSLTCQTQRVGFLRTFHTMAVFLFFLFATERSNFASHENIRHIHISTHWSEGRYYPIMMTALIVLILRVFPSGTGYKPLRALSMYFLSEKKIRVLPLIQMMQMAFQVGLSSAFVLEMCSYPNSTLETDTNAERDPQTMPKSLIRAKQVALHHIKTTKSATHSHSSCSYPTAHFAEQNLSTPSSLPRLKVRQRHPLETDRSHRRDRDERERVTCHHYTSTRKTRSASCGLLGLQCYMRSHGSIGRFRARIALKHGKGWRYSVVYMRGDLLQNKIQRERRCNHRRKRGSARTRRRRSCYWQGESRSRR